MRLYGPEGGSLGTALSTCGGWGSCRLSAPFVATLSLSLPAQHLLCFAPWIRPSPYSMGQQRGLVGGGAREAVASRLWAWLMASGEGGD